MMMHFEGRMLEAVDIATREYQAPSAPDRECCFCGDVWNRKRYVDSDGVPHPVCEHDDY